MSAGTTLTISIYCRDNGGAACRCVEALVKSNPGARLEVLVTNDASTDNTYALLNELAARYSGLRVLHNGVFLGYSECHNRALGSASGEYFTVLDPTVIVTEDGWLETLSAVLGDGRTAVCGIEGTPCCLDDDGEGITDPAAREYVDGSCLMVPSALAKRYGFFSPETPSGYHADKDLSLRYRQMGYSIGHARLGYKLQESGRGHAGPDSREMDAARRRFRLRWGGYLDARRFSNRVLVDTGAITGLGDLLSVTPALRRLRRAHPTAEIVLATRAAELFRNNGNVDTVVPEKSARTAREGYDAVLTPGVSRYYQGRLTIPQRLAYDMGLVLDDLRLDYYGGDEGMDAYLDGLGLSGTGYVVVGTVSGHDDEGWEGRTLSMELSRSVCERIISEGLGVVQVGTGQEDILKDRKGFVSLVGWTDIQCLAWVLKGARVAVLTDSFPLHLAQSLRVRTLAVFGATLPESRITDYSSVEWASHPGLDCTGCYMRKPEGGFNRCLRGDVACMHSIPEGFLEERVSRFIRGETAALPEEHLRLMERTRSLVEDSEAMSQDIMAVYGALKKTLLGVPLRFLWKLERFRPLRPVVRGIIRAVKRRLAVLGRD